jgi:EAL domain-containing protein (putative c-di-GMP-specific phosphodiesterase class I)
MQCVTQTAKWYLSECAPAAGLPRIIALNSFPFLVGRQPNSTFCLPMPNVSKLHAKIELNNGRLFVQDLESRNGTFVNQRRVSSVEPLREGDLLQFATSAFRLRRETADEQLQTVSELPVVLAESLCQFDRLMSAEAVIPHFQSVVRLSDTEVVGYELLARSGLVGLEMPAAMFQMAERLGHEVQLSMMLRRAGVQAARELPGKPMFYLNMHPKEIGTTQLNNSLTEIRRLAPALRITIEVHEAAVADEKALLDLRAAAHGLGMQLAYDDFGAGQARLDELARVAPDCVKFDMKLVRGLHKATSERRLVTARLVELVRDLGIVPLAEGVELAEEAEACRQIGFDLGQGYYFGRPQPMRKAEHSARNTV